MRREIPISDISGAKAHANVLKGLSTDYKSGGIRIGLMRSEYAKSDRFFFSIWESDGSSRESLAQNPAT